MQYMPSGNRSCACHIGSPCLTATRPSASELGVSHNVSHRSWACGIGWACGIDWACGIGWACLITTRPSGRASQLQDPHPNHAHASTHSKKFLNGMLALVHWLWCSVYVCIGEPDTDQSTLDCILLHLSLLHHSLHPHDLFFTFFYLVSCSIVGTASKLLVIHTNTFVHCIEVKFDRDKKTA